MGGSETSCSRATPMKNNMNSAGNINMDDAGNLASSKFCEQEGPWPTWADGEREQEVRCGAYTIRA
jgi:hypothetical protein